MLQLRQFGHMRGRANKSPASEPEIRSPMSPTIRPFSSQTNCRPRSLSPASPRSLSLTRLVSPGWGHDAGALRSAPAGGSQAQAPSGG